MEVTRANWKEKLYVSTAEWSSNTRVDFNSIDIFLFDFGIIFYVEWTPLFSFTDKIFESDERDLLTIEWVFVVWGLFELNFDVLCLFVFCEYSWKNLECFKILKRNAT